MARDYSTNQWRRGQIVDKLGAVTYNVLTEDERIWKRHIDQLRPREEANSCKAMSSPSIVKPLSIDCDNMSSEACPTPRSDKNHVNDISVRSRATDVSKPGKESIVDSSGRGNQTSSSEPRRSSRICKPPQRLDL